MKVRNYRDFTKAVQEWNAARYEQVQVHELTVQLLEEEAAEAEEAFAGLMEEGTIVAAAKAIKEIVDIMYVAEGALWKANVSPNEQDFSDAEFEMHALYSLDFFAVSLLRMAITDFKLDKNVTKLASRVQRFGFCGLEECGVSSLEQAYEVLNAVCISNASKSITRTAADKKANAVDKGPLFVKAEASIEAILGRGQNYVC